MKKVTNTQPLSKNENAIEIERTQNEWKKQFPPEIIKAAEEAVKSGRPIDLTDDITFKLFFAGNTPESRKCLCSFLSAVIGTKVTNAEVINSEILPEMINDKSRGFLLYNLGWLCQPKLYSI